MMNPVMDSRVLKLRKLLKAGGIQAFIITNTSNLFYLTGLKVEGCIGLVTQDNVKVLATGMLYGQIKKLTKGIGIINGKQDLLKAVKEYLQNKKIRRLAFEKGSSLYRFYTSLVERFKGYKIIPGNDYVESLRVIKGEEEIKLIKEGVRAGKKSFNYIKRRIKPGKTENELAAIMEYYLKSQLALGISFPTIVASGPNSAYPHHIPGKRIVERGDTVLVDSGCSYKGYSSDLTRTYFLSKICSSRLKGAYSAVHRAQKEAIGLIKPGIRCSMLYDRALKILQDAGFGDYFIHGLGHGIGIDVHEKPFINHASRDILEAGMVITIEPGVYIQGLGGVRLEDVVLVTRTGHKVL